MQALQSLSGVQSGPDALIGACRGRSVFIIRSDFSFRSASSWVRACGDSGEGSTGRTATLSPLSSSVPRSSSAAAANAAVTIAAAAATSDASAAAAAAAASAAAGVSGWGCASLSKRSRKLTLESTGRSDG